MRSTKKLKIIEAQLAERIINTNNNVKELPTRISGNREVSTPLISKMLAIMRRNELRHEDEQFQTM